MAIVSSSFTVGVVQRDGRRFITEIHTDNTGATHRIEYLGESPDDSAFENPAVIMAARAVTLDQGLKQFEIEQILSDLRRPLVKYVTKAALLVVWRERFREARREQAAQLAKWILDHLEAGEWTDAQLRALFGLNPAEYTALKLRLDDLRTRWNQVQAAAGE